MEEWIGSLWHKYITGKASNDFIDAQVEFSHIAKSLGMVYRALGGETVKRVEAANAQDYLVRRSFLQKIAGTNQQVSLAWQDDESLRLPETLAIFPSTELNYDLYIWLTVIAAQHSGQFQHWAIDNQQLVVDVLTRFPTLKPRYQRLAQAFVKTRMNTDHLPEQEQVMERAIIQAILHPGSITEFPVVNYAPQAVYLWLYPSATLPSNVLADFNNEELPRPESNNIKKGKKSRKAAERVDSGNENEGMMIFRLETMFSFTEFSKLDRGSDDSDDDDCQSVADDLDKITLAKQTSQKVHI